MTFLPEFRVVEAAGASKLAFVLHGALGSGQNFNRYAHKLSELRPEYRLVLVDLRHHGRSRGAPLPNTLAACARDLIALGEHLGQPPSVLIGHSFGGKVAMEYARLVSREELSREQLPEEELSEEQLSGEQLSEVDVSAAPAGPGLRQVWVLDAVPGEQPDGEQNSEVAAVIRAVRAVPVPAQSRRDVVQHLQDVAGLSSGLAEWMATNLERRDEGYAWMFNLDGIEELMRDYFRVDLWEFLAQARSGPEFRLVVAERSDRWTPALRARGQALPPQTRVRYHELPNSGHWVHVDNPAALLELMARHLI
jgi:pimeloyl-ACP methyl ester carboxylesterase